eukprot:TRINITY_DN1949_c0_g1_i1.p1 TRINITY_DN1949_c0_g1~~TRINITY_DN1949_c0_g1_i1.p1  ORF type:complete len:685 (-),score=128.46 TRINITY_DN1949_c0_g1_i1:411-2465(-)
MTSSSKADTDFKDSKQELPKLSDSSFIREDWIEQQLQKRINEFTEEKKFTFFMGTWNVQAKKPPTSGDLTLWLNCDSTASPDIYAVGFQEIVDLNASNLLVDHNASRPWELLIEKTLKPGYEQLLSKHLVGLLLCIYVKKTLRPHIIDLQSDTAGVGIMGVGGNKGGVAARFCVYDSTICILNSHLAAHKSNVTGRNSDYHNICNKIKFIDKNKHHKQNTFSVFEHDYFFWIGDLNYRLNLNDPTVIYKNIQAQDWKFLLAYDQLITEKSAGNAFKKFQEGPIMFPPTYKFKVGTSEYDRRDDNSRSKNRLPAWCDRVQWLGDEAQLLWYKACGAITHSDHKPVMGLFEVPCKVMLLTKKKALAQQLGRQLDAWENECIPKVSVSSNSIQFKSICFDEPTTQTLRIENTGQVGVQFNFYPKLQDESYCKPWLKVKPEFGIILPKECIDITLTVHIDKKTATPLLTGQDTFDDILILKLANGRDYFITVQGEYQRSCFGATVEFLCNMPTPVRTPPTTKDVPRVLSLPKELWRIVDYLFKNGMDAPGLFLTPGHMKEIDKIRECLDVGQEFGKFSVHSMAEAFVRFLESLGEPIFPVSLCAQYTESVNLTAWCLQALCQLTPAHYNAFIYIISFLREVLKHADKNELTANRLVLVFSRCIMHEEPHANRNGLVILHHFLTADDLC